MGFAGMGLQHQLAVQGVLVRIVVLVTVMGVAFVEGGVGHQGYVGAVLGIQHKGVLHVAFVALGVNAHFIGFGAAMVMPGLATVSALVEQPYAGMHQIAVAFPFPTVLQIVLPYAGLVGETVVVDVVVVKTVLIV